MIDRIVVHNFQSLKSVDITLGKLTVVVGPSSSGKTALMRALRALASNVRGSQFITQGTKKASISAHTANGVITLERSEAGGTYKLSLNGADKVYTKLGGAVPEDITRALNLQPITTESSSINFAGQFDRPYLLDDSGATVARVLGELTNVSTIFAAVREANRRRTAASSTLKTRKADFEGLKDQAAKFKALPQQQEAIKAAEKAYERAVDIQGSLTRLEQMLDTVETAELLLAQAVIPNVPEIDNIQNLYQKMTSFRNLVVEWRHHEDLFGKYQDQIRQASDEEHSAQDQLHAKLVELGQCPTCGSEIK